MLDLTTLNAACYDLCDFIKYYAAPREEGK